MTDAKKAPVDLSALAARGCPTCWGRGVRLVSVSEGAWDDTPAQERPCPTCKNNIIKLQEYGDRVRAEEHERQDTLTIEKLRKAIRLARADTLREVVAICRERERPVGKVDVFTVAYSVVGDMVAALGATDTPAGED